MRLTVKNISSLLNVSEKTIYRWVAEKKIPAYRVGEQVRFGRAEIIEWANANRVRIDPAVCLETEAEGQSTCSLGEALEFGGIFYRVEGTERDTALRSMVRLLRLPEGIDPEQLLEMLKVREQMASTAIGDGIALPHPRRPILLQVDRPSVTLCFLDQAVDFGALDGKPVFALFTILSPTARAHLDLLSRVALALQNPEVKQALRDRAGRADILQTIRRLEATWTLAAPSSSHDAQDPQP